MKAYEFIGKWKVFGWAVVGAWLAVSAGTSFTEVHASSRQAHRFGIYGSVLGDPVPSFFGVNLGYNLGDIARIHAGYGSLASGLVNGTAYGGGVKFFMPGWNFSPYVGAQYSVFQVDSFLGISLPGGINSGAGILSAGAGIDWQTGFGLNIAGGINLPLGGSSTQTIPHIAIGWFF